MKKYIILSLIASLIIDTTFGLKVVQKASDVDDDDVESTIQMLAQTDEEEVKVTEPGKKGDEKPADSKADSKPVE